RGRTGRSDPGGGPRGRACGAGRRCGLVSRATKTPGGKRSMQRLLVAAAAVLFAAAPARAYDVARVGGGFFGGQVTTVQGQPTTTARFTASGPLMTMD